LAWVSVLCRKSPTSFLVKNVLLVTPINLSWRALTWEKLFS
jgi:hypothetical protein